MTVNLTVTWSGLPSPNASTDWVSLYCRGYPIEEMVGADFVEICYLLINGHLPNLRELTQFKTELTHHSLIHEDMKKFFEGYPPTAHPMAILSAMVASLSAYYPDDPEGNNIEAVCHLPG